MQYRSYALGVQPRWLSNYISSLDFDKEICPYVIDVLKSHVDELFTNGFLNREEFECIDNVLGEFDCLQEFSGYEDIHEAIEYFLIKKCKSAKQVNLGKSRNDQVATAIRLRVREEILDLLEALYWFLKSLYVKAKLYGDSFFPTFTHLQPAQPANLGLYLTSFAEEIVDSISLWLTALDLTDKCPLGAAAAAGSTVPLSRERRCKSLCFSELAFNTLYATTSRLFILASLSAMLNLAVPLLRFTEDMFVFSTPPLGFVEVPSEHAGTSSIMPHKKNPATLEVARAELSKVIGHLTASFTLLKGLPSGYCLDLQQLTPLVWDAFKITRKSLIVLSDFVEKMNVNEDKVKEMLKYPLQAADLAEYLVVKKGLQFRDAYAIVAKAVKKYGYDIEKIAGEVVGREAEEALKDPVSRRNAPGAPGNLAPVYAKLEKALERILKLLEKRYVFWNCLNS